MTTNRYRLPDPKCQHARRGIVRSGSPAGPHAATNVCDRPECIADAIAWATATTRLEAEHVPDALDGAGTGAAEGHDDE